MLSRLQFGPNFYLNDEDEVGSVKDEIRSPFRVTTRGASLGILKQREIDALLYVFGKRPPESVSDRWILQEVPERIRQCIFAVQNVLKDISVFPNE